MNNNVRRNKNCIVTHNRNTFRNPIDGVFINILEQKCLIFSCAIMDHYKVAEILKIYHDRLRRILPLLKKVLDALKTYPRTDTLAIALDVYHCSVHLILHREFLQAFRHNGLSYFSKQIILHVCTLGCDAVLDIFFNVSSKPGSKTVAIIICWKLVSIHLYIEVLSNGTNTFNRKKSNDQWLMIKHQSRALAKNPQHQALHIPFDSFRYILF